MIRIIQSNTETISNSNIINKLYNICNNDIIANGKITSVYLLGNINIDYCYEQDRNFLLKNFNDISTNGLLTISEPISYYIKFEDQLFKNAIKTTLGISRDTILTNETLSMSWNQVKDTMVSLSNTDVKKIDMSYFGISEYPVNSYANQLLHNVSLDYFNLGNMNVSNPNEYFNQRLFDNVFVQYFLCEHTTKIGVFSLRGLGFTEGYFPKLEYIGAAMGKAVDTANGVSYRRSFLFFGENFKGMNSLYEGSYSKGDLGICVIAARTPPKFGTYKNETFEEKTNFDLGQIRGYIFYVPDDCIQYYREAAMWSTLYTSYNDIIQPISELPNVYKEKISQWYNFN